jgi:kynurenine formamidase
MRIVDLSHQVFHHMPVFPGHPCAEITAIKTIPEHGRSLEHLSFTSHAGTHMDAPSHFIPDGKTVDGIPLTSLMGRASIVDLTRKKKGSLITLDDLTLRTEMFREDSMVLLKTGWDRHFGSPDFFDGYPFLTPDAARWIASRGISLLGMDTPSPGPAGPDGDTVHKELLGGGVILIESLCNLDMLYGKTFTLIALPLNLKGCSGAPCRAIAILEDE